MRSLIYLGLIVAAGCGEVVTAKPDASVDAKPIAFTVTVVPSGPGSGTITSDVGIDCGADCTSDALQPGTQVTLTATANADSALSSWGVAECADPAQPCTFTVNADVTVNAAFKKIFSVCADINSSNGYQVVVEPGKVVLGPDAGHAVRCTQVDANTIRIHATAGGALHFSNEGIFAGRGALDQTVRDRPENIVGACKRLGYSYAHGRSTTVNSTNVAVTVNTDFNGFQVAAAGDDWMSFECSRVSKGKTCAQINDANGYQVVISPGQVVLGPAAGYPVRCTQIGPDQIHIYETGNFDTLRYAAVGIFAGRSQFDQAVRAMPEQIERICNFLGYPIAFGTTTGVNSSIEALVNADMAGFTLPPAGDDWLHFDCKH